jgi:hypothetical protein
VNAVIVLPFGLSFELWVEFLINTFPNEQIPLPFPVEEWWEWAYLFIQNPTFNLAPIPDKQVYKTEAQWSDWAILFIQSFNAAQAN